MTSVRLLSHTENPIETLYSIWQASRHNETVPYPDELNELEEDEAMLLFEKILEAGIPVAENVWFCFLLEDVPISLREQLVRHRIGVKVGERVGADHAPDLADSTWWSQSMRILDMGKFAETGRYDTPATIKNKSTARAEYDAAMRRAGISYRMLVELGVPMEDARNVIPLGATHRLTWSLNLAALRHIIGKRGCWILQLGVWEPVIRGMVECLAKEISPLFRSLINPPCVRGDDFTSCKFCLDNERRVAGEDEIPPCPLYLYHHGDEALRVELTVEGAGWRWDQETARWESPTPVKNERMREMTRAYGKLWGRDTDTGKRR